MQHRGMSLWARLVLATSLFVVIVAGVAVWFAQRSIDDLVAEGLRTRRSREEAAIARESELTIRASAAAVANTVANRAIPELSALLHSAIALDKGRPYRTITWLSAVDTAGEAVAATEDAPPASALATLPWLAAEGQITRTLLPNTSHQWILVTPLYVGGSRVGRLYMGLSTAGLDADVAQAMAAAAQTIDKARQKIWLVGGAVLALGALFAMIQGLRLAQPIRAMTTQARRIASGDMNERVVVGRSDELGVLARSFNDMADQIATLLGAEATKLSLERELSLARKLQQAMLPSTALDTHGHFRVIGHCAPASSCGGDWWVYRKLSRDRLLLVLGDATGHGLHSAMIAAVGRGAVEALGSVNEELLTPEHALRSIHAAICNLGDHDVRMTCFAAVLDAPTGILHYANAAQNFPYVLRTNDRRLVESVSVITSSSTPLGDRGSEPTILRGSRRMRPGDVLVMFTDGLVERTSPTGRLFGERRLRGTLVGQSVTDDAALVALRDHVVGTVETFADGTTADDDTTLVICHYDPPAVPVAWSPRPVV